MIKVVIVFGTRPEVIKMASLIREFRSHKLIDLSVCFTGQHKQMVYPLLDLFSIDVDKEFDIMTHNQTLSELTVQLVASLDKYFKEVMPDIVFVQGDTTTAYCAATVAFYNKIKVAHIEAGLRTNDIYSPFPEEFNRQVISKVANYHFAPTQDAASNLLKEGVLESNIFLVGNSVIDSLLYVLSKKVKNEIHLESSLPLDKYQKMILITGHRRENFGEGFENICNAIKKLSAEYPNVAFVYPVHLNPNVQEPVNRILANANNVFLIPPAGYLDFIFLMKAAYFILTDSGGVQEEAPSLNKPILIMRESTERQEVVDAGAGILVGTDIQKIVSEARKLFEDNDHYLKMASVANPYGAGDTAQKVVSVLLSKFLK
ncbi:MAG: UDP-N-acetylglucosamine 2-epimerase (non-hydrolyzing) [Chitinophagaceae bacterium]|nr:UDP-N-acetylglucosamine 2-epimerase (non-hydrolyzing) [Chitinophagaceae bacterium]